VIVSHAVRNALLPVVTILGRSTGRLLGGSVSLRVGLVEVGIAILIGVPLGLLSGYFGGPIDELIMRVMDGLIAFPSLILALAIVAALGSSALNVMIAIGITTLPVYARLVRAEVLSLKAHDFVLAARSIGATDLRVMLRRIWPNATATVIVQGSLGMGFAILAEAGLSFLGIGVSLATPTWGGMLQQGFPFIHINPWLPIVPGLAIFLVVLSFNFLGGGAQRDPRASYRSVPGAPRHLGSNLSGWCSCPLIPTCIGPRQ
jgi:peptide/nickel transport system permease protein